MIIAIEMKQKQKIQGFNWVWNHEILMGKRGLSSIPSGINNFIVHCFDFYPCSVGHGPPRSSLPGRARSAPCNCLVPNPLAFIASSIKWLFSESCRQIFSRSSLHSRPSGQDEAVCWYILQDFTVRCYKFARFLLTVRNLEEDSLTPT